MLKSAYLALFRVVGYRYVLSAAGDCLRQALAGFVSDRADKERADRYFARFKGVFKPALGAVPESVFNTLRDGTVWFHYQKDGASKNLLFAVSCLFQVNSRLVTVMVPYSVDGSEFDAAYAYNEATLIDISTPQDIHLGQITDECVCIDPRPLPVHFAPPDA